MDLDLTEKGEITLLRGTVSCVTVLLTNDSTTPLYFPFQGKGRRLNSDKEWLDIEDWSLLKDLTRLA